MNLEEQKEIASRKQKKGIDIKYYNTDFDLVLNPDTTFSGYVVRTEKNTLSNIKEYENGKEIGIISFRPTQTPTINVVRYKSYYEERYANGNLSLQFNATRDSLFGEYIKYDQNGDILMRYYYNNNVNCTEEIMDFIGFNGTIEEFKYYTFKEDEEFNILMRYGSHFKLLKEQEKKPQYFDGLFERLYKKIGK